MIDVKALLRTAYYLLLNGKLSNNGVNVPVYDDTLGLADPSTLYVIMADQQSANKNTLASFDSEETIVFDIVYKAATRVNKQVLDNVAGQILNLVCPTPYGNALPPQVGMSFNAVRVIQDRYLTSILNNSNTVVRRLITFSQYVRQTGDGIPPSSVPFGSMAQTSLAPIQIISASFNNDGVTVSLPILNGHTFILFLNENMRFLTYGTDWVYNNVSNPPGGFIILIPGFNAGSNNYHFYIFLTS